MLYADRMLKPTCELLESKRIECSYVGNIRSVRQIKNTELNLKKQT